MLKILEITKHRGNNIQKSKSNLFSTYSSAWPCRFAAGKNDAVVILEKKVRFAPAWPFDQGKLEPLIVVAGSGVAGICRAGLASVAIFSACFCSLPNTFDLTLIGEELVFWSSEWLYERLKLPISDLDSYIHSDTFSHRAQDTDTGSQVWRVPWYEGSPGMKGPQVWGVTRQ